MLPLSCISQRDTREIASSHKTCENGAQGNRWRHGHVLQKPHPHRGVVYCEGAERNACCVEVLRLCCWLGIDSQSTFSRATGPSVVSSAAVERNHRRSARRNHEPDPVSIAFISFLLLLLLLIILPLVCGVVVGGAAEPCSPAVSFQQQGEEEEEEETDTAAASWRTGADGLLRSGGRNWDEIFMRTLF